MARTNLVGAPLWVVLPAEDLTRAKAFWADTLGFEFTDTEAGSWARAGEGTGFFIYERGRTKAEHTVAMFSVGDIVATVAELRAAGVVFEEYPQLGTVDGITTAPDGSKAAWFTDSEGNIVNIVQM